jgi:polysaccharide chain length determinant protein (PEP-CTERM system associated)
MQLSPEQLTRTLLNETFNSRRFLVATFVFVNAAMLTAGLLWPKAYTASTSILVDERTIIQPLMQGAAVATDALDRSRNAREVIFGRKIMDAILEYGGWLKANPSIEEREGLIEEIKKRTLITIVGKNILRIEYKDSEPERAFRVTEKVAELFMQESIAAKAAESRAAFDFIDKQTQEYQDKLTRAESELKELRSATLESNIGSETEVTTRLNDLRNRIEGTQQELREAEVMEASLERQVSGEAESTTDVLREGQYRTRIAELESKLDTLRLSYHDTHPDIVQVKQQIQALTENLNSERTRRDQSRRSGKANESTPLNNPVYQQLRRDQSQNQSQMDALTARLADLKRQLQDQLSRGKRMHSSDARLAELTRDYQINRDIYQDLLRRRENARVSMNMDRERQGLSFKIQEPVSMPSAPSGLRFSHFVLGGLVLGLMLPLLLLYGRLQLDPRIRTGSSIAIAHKFPVVAVVPHLWTPEELKTLRTELVFLSLIVVTTVGVSATLSAMRLLKAI